MAADSYASVTVVDGTTEAGRAQLSYRLNKIINRLADRDDLLLSCVWNPKPAPGQPDAPAWFTPATAQVTINGAVALGQTAPQDVNPLTPEGRREHPVIVGLACHEASHAHSTLWADLNPQEVNPPVLRAAVLLEEPRIESRQLQRRPQDRRHLRAQSLLLDISGFNPSSVPDRWRAANVAVMTLARVDAGVLDPDDVESVEPVVVDLLGDDLPLLRDLWREALRCADGDTSALLDVAARWVDLLGDPPADDSPMLGCAAGVSGSGQDGPPQEGDDDWDDPDSGGSGGDASDGDDDEDSDDADGGPGGGSAGGQPGDDAIGEALAAAVAQATADIAEAVSEEIADEKAAETAQAQAQQDKAQTDKDRAAQKQAIRKAETVFGADAPTSRVLLDSRDPTPEERGLARQVGEVLRKAQFRDRHATRRASSSPPGRLRGREAMLGAAQRSMRSLVTAEPFVATVRRHSPEPPMSMGILIDVSSSMGWAKSIMTTVAWVFAHAATYVHGTTAAVAFGRRVHAVTLPGQPPAKVTPFDTPDSNHDFRGGFTALDGALNLTMGQGVRLLVVVSDGQYEPSQVRAAAELCARLRRNGGHVLWIDNSPAPQIPEGVLLVNCQDDVGKIPAEIAAALAGSLQHAQ